MRPVHYLTVAIAIALIAILYWGVNTVPPRKKGIDQPMAGGATPGMPGAPKHVHAASFDSILNAGRQQLPAHAKEEVAAIEKELAAIQDSSRMAVVFTKLARTWQEHKQLQVAAGYQAIAAKLENSEKKLNFAGQFFLELMRQANSEAVHAWDAEQAVELFQKSLELNPDNDTTKLALAASLIEGQGETMQGVQLLLGITREKPDNIPANLMLGRLSVQSGQLDKAQQRFETVLRQEPKNTEALYFLAETYKGKGDKQKAIALFEQCKSIVNNPEFSKDIDQYINSFK